MKQVIKYTLRKLNATVPNWGIKKELKFPGLSKIVKITKA